MGLSGANAVQFLTFGDYGRVILTDENWSEVFNRVLGDRAEFGTKLKRLTDLRNGVAHSRPLSTSNRLELRALADPDPRTNGRMNSREVGEMTVAAALVLISACRTVDGLAVTVTQQIESVTGVG